MTETDASKLAEATVAKLAAVVRSEVLLATCGMHARLDQLEAHLRDRVQERN